MLYNKPSNVRYVDMCIWIDQHAYDADVNQQMFFQYLYHICYMLSYKSKYFYSSKEYDDFAVYAATKLFLRYTSKNEELNKIKSILNYAKRVIYPYKVQFQQQNYKENTPGIQDSDEQPLIDDSFRLSLDDKINQLNRTDFQLYLTNFHKTVKHIINQTPYKKQSSEYTNIYISCMLTILNSITPNTKDTTHIGSIVRSDKIRENLYDKVYHSMRNDVILYHLDDSYEDYIKVLINRIKNGARIELSQLIYTSVHTDDVINDIYMHISDNNQENRNDEQ